MLGSDRMNAFVSSSQNIVDDCLTCEYRAICRGGCKRHKEPIVNNEPLKNYFCESYKMFYQHSVKKFQDVARMV